MNQFPSPPPHAYSQPVHRPPQQRNRRSAHHAPKKRKGKKKSQIMPRWQVIVLAALSLCLAFSLFSLSDAGHQLSSLLSKREIEKRAYEREVSRHQVKYREWIEYYAAVYQLDPAFVAAIIKTESDYVPTAVSSKNAQGLMQFMPDTFEWIAPKFDIPADDFSAITDPETAIKMGCWLLNYITKQFNGDPILTACAYHAGWGNVEGWITKYSTDGKTLTLDQIPYENTRNYAGKVLNSYAIYQQHYY
ncbi:MAG: lytic transglycosylase domain-containing protein [Clostridiales bacterium]|nr:lytic transglycosylase domain-containing protein [Clostridiales bacterium]